MSVHNINRHNLKETIIRLWDEHVAQVEGSVTLADTVEAIWKPVALELENNDRDFEAEAKDRIRSVLGNERQNRTNQIHREADWIADYMDNPGEGATGIEGLLDHAYSLGTAKGDDKALRYWTPEDLQNKIVGFYRTAADATESARKNDVALTRLIIAVQSRGAATVGEAVDKAGEAAA